MKNILKFIILASIFYLFHYLMSYRLRTSLIIGKIDKEVYQTKTGTYIRVNNENHKLYPVSADESSYDFYFKRIAEMGDSVYKAPYADTLYLYKPNGRLFKYLMD